MDNHQVIDFLQARAAHARSAPPQVVDHSAWLQQIRERSAELERSVAVSQIWLLLLSDRFEAWREDMARTEAFCQACRDACDLTDLPAMERARDRLAAEHRSRFQSAAPDTQAPPSQDPNSPAAGAPAVPAWAVFDAP